MARANIPMVINLRQNTNDDSSAFGKYFAEVDSKEPLNLKGFAKHMTSHGKIADYQMCVLVLGQVVECMSELLAQGQPSTDWERSARVSMVRSRARTASRRRLQPVPMR